MGQLLPGVGQLLPGVLQNHEKFARQNCHNVDNEASVCIEFNIWLSLDRIL